MSYCWNPVCQKPQNPDTNRYCYSCGLPLLLGSRFRAQRLLSDSDQSFFCVDEHVPSQAECIGQRFPTRPDAQSRWAKGALLKLEALASHPQLPRVLAYLERDQNLEHQAPACQYLITENLSGQSLRQRYEKGKHCSEAEIRALLVGILPVLGHIHDNQAIHRAIRPDTILYRDHDQFFGLMNYRDLRFTDEINVLGVTSFSSQGINYRAPEHLLGRDNYASDLYSLGTVCLYLLTGKSSTELFDIEEDTWKWRQFLKVKVSENLCGVLDTLVQRAVKQRYTSVQDVLKDLKVEISQLLSAPQEQKAADEDPLAAQSLDDDLIPVDSVTSMIRDLQRHADTFDPATFDLGEFLADATSLALRDAILFHAAKVANKISPEIEPLLKHLLNTPSLDLQPQAYAVFGHYYLERIKAGLHQSLDIVLAIAAYQKACQLIKKDESQQFIWAQKLGYLYWQLAKAEPKYVEICLERCVNSHRHALKGNSPPRPESALAELQNSLGEALCALANYRQPVEHLEEAITAYNGGISMLDATHMPAQYAAMQNNLGTAYWSLALHQQAIENLQHAVTAYNESLKHYDPEKNALRYGMIQNNLGTAYLNLAQQEQSPELLELAIGAYRIALMYRTLEQSALGYTTTQNNLGTAYLYAAGGKLDTPTEYQEYLQEAVSAYEATLEAVEKLQAEGATAISFELAATCANLGLTLFQLAALKKASGVEVEAQTQCEAAIQAYLRALSHWESQPENYQVVSGYLIQALRMLKQDFKVPTNYPLFGKVPPEIMSSLEQELMEAPKS